MNRLLLFVQLVAVVYGYFEVLEPPSLAGVYTTAPLRLNPVEFNITGELVLADPTNACAPLKNNVTGKIVVSIISFACTPAHKVKHIQDAGGIALAMANYGLDNAHTGFVYYVFPKPGDIEMPAINVAYLDNVIAAVKKGQQGIIVSMSNTTTNPWAKEGQSGVGIAMQVTLELLAFACLVSAVYKLYFFISKTGIQASISQFCLSFEIVAALIRIVYFIQPLQFRNDIAGDNFNEFVEPMFVELAMPITFMTTLLVTFYWQDIFRRIDNQISVQFMKNLDRTKIPFIITVVILWLFQFISMLTRLQVITGVDIVYVLSAIVQLFNVFCVGTFFIITGIKMIKISSQVNRDRYRSLVILVSVTGTMYVIGVLSVLFFLSGINFGPKVLFIYWIYYGSLHIASLSKILGFETNISRQYTKSSHTSMNQVEMKTSSGFTMTSSEVLADSREHDFDDEEEIVT